MIKPRRGLWTTRRNNRPISPARLKHAMRAPPLPGRKLCLNVGLRQPSHGPSCLGARRAPPKSASFSAQYCDVSWFKLEPPVLRRNLPGMMHDDRFDFRPRPGRVRNSFLPCATARALSGGPCISTGSARSRHHAGQRGVGVCQAVTRFPASRPGKIAAFHPGPRPHHGALIRRSGSGQKLSSFLC